jgi:hypothetical protein
MKITNLMTGATKLSGTPTDSYDPIGMTPVEVRLAMVAHGYNPTPINGKRPLLDGWQNIVATPDVVNRWGNVGPNTGMVTRDTPVLDIDILNEEAAQIVEATVRQCLEDNGQILVRVGLPPKRAILLRTDKPFKKTFASLLRPMAQFTRSKCWAMASSLPWLEFIQIQTSRMFGGVEGLQSTPRATFCRRQTI